MIQLLDQKVEILLKYRDLAAEVNANVTKFTFTILLSF